MNRSQNVSGTDATTHWNPRENTPAITMNDRMPNIVSAMVQNAAAILPNPPTPLLIMTTSRAASTAVAMTASTIFHAGRLSHRVLNMAAIWVHDQTHKA